MDARLLYEITESIIRLPAIHRRLTRDIFKLAVIDTIAEEMAPHHVLIMKVLLENGTMSVADIGSRAGISPSQMTHSTDRLAQLDIIERSHDTEDRRRVNVQLTERGKALIETIDRNTRNLVDAMLSGLDEAELESLHQALNVLNATFARLET